MSGRVRKRSYRQPQFPTERMLPWDMEFIFDRWLLELFSADRECDVRQCLDERGVPYAVNPDGAFFTTPGHLAEHLSPDMKGKLAGPLYPLEGFSLSIDEIRQLPTECEWNCGVYFMFVGEELKYIGHSKQLVTRFNQHEMDGKKWDCIRILATDVGVRKAVERRLIRQHLPPWNHLLP